MLRRDYGKPGLSVSSIAAKLGRTQCALRPADQSGTTGHRRSFPAQLGERLHHAWQAVRMLSPMARIESRPFSRFHWKREVRFREQLPETAWIWLAIGYEHAR